MTNDPSHTVDQLILEQLDASSLDKQAQELRRTPPRGPKGPISVRSTGGWLHGVGRSAR
jgi:hypothetical protein